MTAKTILLCDDSRAMRLITSKRLTEAGFDVIGEAENGRQAVEQYRELRPDIVLLDLVMPELDGKEALREILAFDRNAKIIVLSSLGAQSDIEDCLRYGAMNYLQKPIDPLAMFKALKETER